MLKSIHDSFRRKVLVLLFGIFLGGWFFQQDTLPIFALKIFSFLFPDQITWKKLLLFIRQLFLKQHSSSLFLNGKKEIFSFLFLFLCFSRLLHLLYLQGTTRYRHALDLPLYFFKNNYSLSGWVLSVGDGDGFRFYHTPFLFSFLPKTNIMKQRLETIPIRLAGIDAPETAHFGHVGQPYGEEARKWLEKKIHKKHLIIYPHRLDQYGRLVSSVYYRRWFFFQHNLSLKLVQEGLAEVYIKGGAEYGGIYKDLLRAEINAKRLRKGMWSQKKYTSPTKYKEFKKKTFNSIQTLV